MGKLDAFNRVKEVGIIPAMRTSSKEDAVRAVGAILEGGIDVIEISIALEDSLEVLAAVVAAHSNAVLIGAGTVVDAEGVRQAALAGAKFIVTPGFSADAVAKAKEFDLAMFAGALTPTEVQTASASGADAVKLFPCFASGGTRYLKALIGQYPNTNFIASGGVGLDNCSDYIRSGACAIGVGGEIADFESLSKGDYRVFTVRARRLREAVIDARTVMEESVSFNVRTHRRLAKRDA
jgi:2-dehydro-3-deoxyphosphogluconate aldolase/(4S)-4-hydroxy-2-oxoglutarate aldolase